jgi:hypothetical protein
MMTYDTHALVRNVHHYVTSTKPVKRFAGRLKHCQKKNQKFEPLEITLLVLSGVKVAQVESTDLREYGI